MMTPKQTLDFLIQINDRLQRGQLATAEQFALLCTYPTVLLHDNTLPMEDLRFNLNLEMRLVAHPEPEEQDTLNQKIRAEMLTKARRLMPKVTVALQRIVKDAPK